MDNDNLKDYLREMDFHSFAKVNKSLLITILIKQGMYVGAYDLLCEYGYEEIDPRDLLRLCSRMILNLEFEYEEELLLLAHHIFRENTYDEVVLEYLTKYFEGPVDEMIRVWERSMGFSIEAYELEEDILTYSMFTSPERLRKIKRQGTGDTGIFKLCVFPVFCGGKRGGGVYFPLIGACEEKRMGVRYCM